MKATEHPEYFAENNHLLRVIEAVRHRVARMEQREVLRAAHDREDVLWDLQHDFVAASSAVRAKERIRTYKHALGEPYFLRLDVKIGEEKNRQCLYIGKIGLPLEEDMSVVDWRAPIAVLRHERTVFSTYYAPEGAQQAEIFLNRSLGIRDCNLVEIIDYLDRRTIEQGMSEEGEAVAAVDPDVFLRRALEGRAGQKMREIVETIQKEQEELIRLPVEQPLIIQGAAGTGKTVVGLHRLAYLLYPGHEHDLSPSSILVIAPTKLFIDSISEVLPDLDIRPVRMQTFEDWALNQLLGNTRHSVVKLKSAVPTDGAVQEIKHSLAWPNLVSYWLEHVQHQVLTNTQNINLSLEASTQTVPYDPVVTASRISQLLTDNATLPIQTQFAQALEELKSQIRKDYLKQWNQETQTRRHAVVHEYEKLAPMRGAIVRINERISQSRKEFEKISNASASALEIILHRLRREELRELQRELQVAHCGASSEEIKSLENMIEAVHARIHDEQTDTPSLRRALESEARYLIRRGITRLERQEQQLQTQYRESDDYDRYLAQIRARNAIDLSSPQHGSQRNFERALHSLYDQLQEQLNWPNLRAEKQFVEMLLTISDPDALERVFGHSSSENFQCDELLALHTWANANIEYLKTLGNLEVATEQNPLELYHDDLAPVLSFQVMLGEVDRQQLTTKLTLVDEAQDRTLLELWLLAQYSHTGWFTLVGDLAQKLDARRGINDWRLLRDIFGSLQYRELRRSYRSTYEITELANSVLAWSKGNLPLAEPFERHGPQPKFVQVRSDHELLKALTAELDRVKARGILEIGIVCKDAGEARHIFEGLVNAEVADISQITDETSTIPAGVNVLPIAIAKGLEFPWVIMPNASTKQFATIQDGYLLYIGITRALHGITLISKGKFSHYFDRYSA